MCDVKARKPIEIANDIVDECKGNASEHGAPDKFIWEKGDVDVREATPEEHEKYGHLIDETHT